MKKNKFLKILCIAIVLCITSKAKAYYNGSGGIIASVSPGTGCTSTTPMCYNGDSKSDGSFFLQARLYYIDNTNGKFEWSDGKGNIDSPVGYDDGCSGTYFFADSTSAKELVNTYKIKQQCVFTMSWSHSWVHDDNRYEKMSAALRKYFGDDVNNCEGKLCTPNDNLKKFLNGVTSGDWSDTSDSFSSVLTKDSDVAITSAKKVSDGATKGYRLIIEPAIIWNYTNTKYKSGIYTPKQAASYGFKNTSASKPFTGATGQAQYLYTEFSDVGIDYGSHAWCSTKATVKDLADWKNGCGMNIIDIGKYVSVHYCYNQEMAGGLNCEYNDRNNEGDFKETFRKYECEAEKAEKETTTEDGKLVAKNNNCNVYCYESAHASFPGGISQSSELGMSLTPNSYFAWPARYGEKTGMPMYMSSTLKCRVVQKDGKTCTSDDISAMVSAVESIIDSSKMKISAKVTGGNTRKINAEELVVGNITITKDGTSELKIENGKTGEFTVTKKTYLEIKTNTNRYYNKSTGAVSDNGSSWTGTEIFDRGQGVISLGEKNTEIGKKYYLEISDVKLGTDNIFGQLIGKYKCGYQVDIGCKCGSGTLNEGSELYKDLTDGKTCLELQETYCGCRCPETSPEWGLDLTEKLSDNPTTAECNKLQQTYCYKHCDKVDDNTFSSCMLEQKEKYKRTWDEAYNICYDKYCPPTRCNRVPQETWDKCISDGYSFSTCYRKYCPYPGCKNCKYTCKTTSGEEKDISQCISDRQMKYGETFKDARARCNATYCPSGDTCENGKCPPGGNNCTGKCTWSVNKKGNTITYVKTCDGKVCLKYPVYCPSNNCLKSNNIIYRTIDLDNPFPSNGKNGVTKEFSNNGVKGRLPSSNWYYKEKVNEEILNARGAKGNKLYTEKQPLYTITLTPSVTKAIRKYNKGKEYSDFTLTCNNANKTSACISSFLHKEISNAFQKGSIDACRKLTTKSSESDFNDCYNKNN